MYNNYLCSKKNPLLHFAYKTKRKTFSFVFVFTYTDSTKSYFVSQIG